MTAKKKKKQPVRPKKPGQVTKPEKFSIETIEKVLRNNAGIIMLAAKKLKCNRQTVVNYIARYPYLQAVLAQIEEEHLDLGEGVVVKHMRQQHLGAAQWYLTHKGKARGYGQPSVVIAAAPGAMVHTGILKVGEPLPEAEWTRQAQDYLAQAKPLQK